jgi:O-antigen ligase
VGLSHKLSKYPQTLVVSTLSIVTLFFTTRAIDPFSLPKLLFLILFSSILLPTLFEQIRSGRISKSKFGWLHFTSLGGFLLITLLSALFSQNPVNGVWGEYGRNNGFLAYLSLAIIGFAVFTFFESPRALILVLAIVAFVANFYGVMQHFDADFVTWNNPFNPVITTFGNPNFAAAFTGIAAGSYLYLFLFEKERLLKYFAILGMSASVAVIVFSRVTQSLFTFAVSVGVPLLYWLYLKSRKVANLAIFISIAFGVLSILGVLRIGPLAEVLGKSSFLYRTDYWQAAWKMMIANPWLGVGTDQYGNYFQEYRSLEQINRVNAAVMANNAHNVFLQIGATIGVIGLILSLVLALGPVVKSIKSFSLLNGRIRNEQVVGLGIFLAYLVQATVSIDHIALAIWGWAFGAIIFKTSLYSSEKIQISKRKEYKRTEKKINPLILASIVCGLSVSPILISKALYDIRLDKSLNILWPSDAGQGPTDPTERQLATKTILDAYGKNNYDPQYTLMVAKSFGIWQENELAISFAKEVLLKEPRSYDAWNLIASIYERSDRLTESIPYRLKTIEYDPNNYDNKLLLALTYQRLGNKSESLLLAQEVIRDCPESKGAYQVATKIVSELKA